MSALAVTLTVDELEALVRKCAREATTPRDEVMTRSEVAKLLKVTERTVVSYVENCGLPGYRLSANTWRFLKEEVLAWKPTRKRALRKRKVVVRGTRQVYFIRAASGLVKIGTSHNVSHRINSMQTGSAEKLSILGMLPGDESLERQLHERFAQHRVRGEWFSPASEILEFVAKNCDAEGRSQ